MVGKRVVHSTSIVSSVLLTLHVCTLSEKSERCARLGTKPINILWGNKLKVIILTVQDL